MERSRQRSRMIVARHTLHAALWMGWALVGINAWVISQL